MRRDDREREFRLRPPRKHRAGTDEARVWSGAFKQMMRLARMSSKKRKNSRSRSHIAKPFMQRCAVRVTYSPNRSAGQWAAHGRYVERETATNAEPGRTCVFATSGATHDIHRTLGEWQKAGDPRLFKLIISPEFGDRVD